MLDRELQDLARRIVNPGLEARAQRLREKHLGLVQQMVSRGVLASSMTMQLTTRMCAEELHERADFAWQSLQRVMKEAGIVDSPELAQDLKHELRIYLNQIWIELRTFAEGAIRRIWPQYEAPVEDATRTVELAYAQAGDRLMPEVDLFVAGLRADRERSEKEKATVIHYNITVTGPGNVVQTGNQATANVQQVITANDSQMLVDALARVLTFLEQTADLPDQQKRELVEVAKEASAEAKKDTPNRTKLAGLLGVLSGTIQALKAAKDVYDLLKTAAGPFGINLPDV
ncbi:MAG: hypothetical protein ACREYF_00185 [Gammaproteobacteria bacterium]